MSSSLSKPLASSITKSMYNYHQLYRWFNTYIQKIIEKSHKKIISPNHYHYIALCFISLMLQMSHHLNLQNKTYDKNNLLAQFVFLIRIMCKVWFESNQEGAILKDMIQIKITGEISCLNQINLQQFSTKIFTIRGLPNLRFRFHKNPNA